MSDLRRCLFSTGCTSALRSPHSIRDDHQPVANWLKKPRTKRLSGSILVRPARVRLPVDAVYRVLAEGPRSSRPAPSPSRRQARARFSAVLARIQLKDPLDFAECEACRLTRRTGAAEHPRRRSGGFRRSASESRGGRDADRIGSSRYRRRPQRRAFRCRADQRGDNISAPPLRALWLRAGSPRGR